MNKKEAVFPNKLPFFLLLANLLVFSAITHTISSDGLIGIINYLMH